MKLFNKINYPKKQQIQSDSRYIPKPFKDIAQGLETEFLQFMIKQMNKTVNKFESESSATDYYKSLLDHERSKIMSKNQNGQGLQKLILDQIYPKRLRNELAYNHYLNQKQLFKKQNIQSPNNIRPVPAKDVNSDIKSKPILLNMESNNG